MSKYTKQIISPVNMLYNKILLLSRNKLFYTNFDLNDNFQNRIHLIFIHVSFIFVKIKQENINKNIILFNQSMFDLIFREIEGNMREIGFGDTTVNTNMTSLTKTFYNILLNCEKYTIKTENLKNSFFSNYLEKKSKKLAQNNTNLIKYFDKYQTFCFDLNTDSVLKGELSFNYKWV